MSRVFQSTSPPLPRSRPATARRGTPSSARAFTLIELMVVIGIMAIVMTTSIPAIYHIWRKDSFRKAVVDASEVFSNARAQAILHGTMTEVVLHPQDRRLEVSGAAGSAAEVPGAPSGSGLSTQFSDRVLMRGLFINQVNYSDAEVARVRFYPNGTCDEMLLILDSDQNDQLGISLELTTSLVNVLSQAELQTLRMRMQ